MKSLKNKHKEKIKTACENFILLDLRPFMAVEEEGFIRLCQTMIDIGVQLEHRIPLSEVRNSVPVGSTLSRRIAKRELVLRESLREQVQG